MMDKLWLFLLLQLLFMLSASQKTNLDSPMNLKTYRIFRNWILRNFGKYSNNQLFYVIMYFIFIKKITC